MKKHRLEAACELAAAVSAVIALVAAAFHPLWQVTQLLLCVGVMIWIARSSYWRIRAGQWRWAYRQARDLDRFPTAGVVLPLRDRQR